MLPGKTHCAVPSATPQREPVPIASTGVGRAFSRRFWVFPPGPASVFAVREASIGAQNRQPSLESRQIETEIARSKAQVEG